MATEAKGTEGTEGTAKGTEAKAKVAPMSREALEARTPEWARKLAHKAAPDMVATEVTVANAKAKGMLAVYFVIAGLYAKVETAEGKNAGPADETAEGKAERAAKVARSTVYLALDYATEALASDHDLKPETIGHCTRQYLLGQKHADGRAAEGTEARNLADTLADWAKGNAGTLGVKAFQDAIKALRTEADKGKGGRKPKSPDTRVLDIMAKVAKGLTFDGKDYGAAEFVGRFVGQLSGGKLDKGVTALMADVAGEMIRVGLVEIDA